MSCCRNIYQDNGELTSSGLKHVPASLTLGGYDTNRFLPHNTSFALDPYQNPVAAINEITVSAQTPPSSGAGAGSGWNTNPATLLKFGEADLFTIDSSTPFLWLPESVCKRFETALGLVYDTNLQLYTFGHNASQHDALVNWNLTFNFVIADLPGSAKAVNISLPYSAFDLQLSYPYPGLNATSSSPAINYFPLRKAANSSQYTIGRTFLQEAYLIVDYERNNFSVHQATFAIDALTNYSLVSIDKSDNSTLSDHDTSTSSSLSKGTIVGIVVACAVVLAAILASLIFWLRRRRHTAPDEKSSWPRNTLLPWFKHKPKGQGPSELLGETKYPVEVQAKSRVVELPANTPQELEGTEVIKDIIHVPGQEEQNAPQTLTLPYGHDPKYPIELHSDTSTPQREYYAPEPSPLTPPAYSPSRVGQARNANRHSTNVSGDVSRDSSPLTSPGLVSPITPGAPLHPDLYTQAPHMRLAYLGTESAHLPHTPTTASRDISRDSSPLTTPGLVSPIIPGPLINRYTQAPYTRSACVGAESTHLPHTPTTVSRDVSRESSPLSTPGLVSPLTPGMLGLPVSLHADLAHDRTHTQTEMETAIGRERDRAVGRNDSRLSRFREEGMMNPGAGAQWPSASPAVEAERERRREGGSGGEGEGEGEGEGRRYERYSWEE